MFNSEQNKLESLKNSLFQEGKLFYEMTANEWGNFEKKFCSQSNTTIQITDTASQFISTAPSQVFTSLTSRNPRLRSPGSYQKRIPENTKTTENRKYLDDFYKYIQPIYEYNDTWDKIINKFKGYSTMTGGAIFGFPSSSPRKRNTPEVSVREERLGDKGKIKFENLISKIYKGGKSENLKQYFSKQLSEDICNNKSVSDGCQNQNYRWNNNCYRCMDPLSGRFCKEKSMTGSRKSSTNCQNGSPIPQAIQVVRGEPVTNPKSTGTAPLEASSYSSSMGGGKNNSNTKKRKSKNKKKFGRNISLKNKKRNRTSKKQSRNVSKKNNKSRKQNRR